MSESTKKTVIIIGGGPAGIFSARALEELGYHPIIVEKEAVLGGKCSTYTYKNYPDLKTEWGAGVITPNYGIVLDAAKEKKIIFETRVGVKDSSLTFFENFRQLTFWEKIAFIPKFLAQTYKFTQAVSTYQDARDNQLPLPIDFDLPFETFAKKYGLEDINVLLKPYVTGFGYGAMIECKASEIFEYMGKTTIPSIIAGHMFPITPVVGIKNGYQYFMEQVAEDYTAIKSATVTQIDRSEAGVDVIYQDSTGKTETLHGEALVLAISPQHWNSLGMKLTPVEQQCCDAVEYYNYPVAVCRITGHKPEWEFFPEALEIEGFGKVALVTTRDYLHSEDVGILFTAYINLRKNEKFDFNEQAEQKLIAELKAKPNVKDVTVLAKKMWGDYMSTLKWPFKLALEKQQMLPETKTIYVGSAPLGGFEDVNRVGNRADETVRKYIGHLTPSSTIKEFVKQAQRFFFFFTNTRVPPVGYQKDEEEKAQVRLAG